MGWVWQGLSCKITPCKAFRQFILVRNLTDVMSVEKSSVKNHIFDIIGEFILERDLLDVMSVASVSVKIHTLDVIGEYIQRNLSDVSSVENPLLRSQHSLNIRKSIHERSLCDCGVWWKSLKLKIWTSHPTVGQRIHTTEKPYRYQECGNILGLMRKFILDRNQIYMCSSVRSLEHEFIRERFLTSFTNVKKRKEPYP